MQNCRKHPSIHNYRHAKAIKCKIKSKLYFGYCRIAVKEVNVTFNGSKVSLPKIVIKFRDKFKVRYMMLREPLLFHMQVDASHSFW